MASDPAADIPRLMLIRAHALTAQPSWPHDLDDCMRHAIAGPLIRARARHLINIERMAAMARMPRLTHDARSLAAGPSAE